jgi:CheY-like chemotaxis protein
MRPRYGRRSERTSAPCHPAANLQSGGNVRASIRDVCTAAYVPLWLNVQTVDWSIRHHARGATAITPVRVPAFIERQIGCSPLVLMVEDVEETRDGIEKLRTADGYRVEPARNEHDAVTRASRCCPDLILVSLAGSPSAVVAAAVRIRRRAGIDTSVPVVVFCVPTIEERAEVMLGRNVWARRPDNFDQLRELLGRLLVRSLGLG